MSDRPVSQDQLAALLERGKKEKQLTEVEIENVLGDLNTEVSQLFLEQLDEAGVVVISSDNISSDDDDVLDVDLDNTDSADEEEDTDDNSDGTTSAITLKEALSELGLSTRLDESDNTGNSKDEDDYVDNVIALADDPVRMYLKEIGQVELLDSNRETSETQRRRSSASTTVSSASRTPMTSRRVETSWTTSTPTRWRRCRDTWSLGF